MPETHRKPNEHAKRTGELVKKIKHEHPGMNHQTAFGIASKQAAGKKKGGFLLPAAIAAPIMGAIGIARALTKKKGEGLHIAPYGSGYKKHRGGHGLHP